MVEGKTKKKGRGSICSIKCLLRYKALKSRVTYYWSSASSCAGVSSTSNHCGPQIDGAWSSATPASSALRKPAPTTSKSRPHGACAAKAGVAVRRRDEGETCSGMKGKRAVMSEWEQRTMERNDCDNKAEAQKGKARPTPHQPPTSVVARKRSKRRRGHRQPQRVVGKHQRRADLRLGKQVGVIADLAQLHENVDDAHVVAWAKKWRTKKSLL